MPPAAQPSTLDDDDDYNQHLVSNYRVLDAALYLIVAC